MNKNYVKGRNFEYYTMSYFRKLGYYVLRAWASKGLFDLLAVPKKDNPTIPFPLLETLVPTSVKKDLSDLVKWFKNSLLIQCKYNGYVPPKERKKLSEFTIKRQISPLIAYSENRKLTFKSIKTGYVVSGDQFGIQ